MTLLFSCIGVCIELAVLFFISQKLTQQLFITMYWITKHRTVSISFITTLLFPGTVIHELSHLFVAEILGVHTGKLTLIPEFEDNSQDIQAGSVAIQKTDPFRRTLIGTAPLFTGLGALTAISYTIVTQWQSWVMMIERGSYWYILLCIAIIYLLFTIPNTMFSSPEDMKGVVPLLLTLSILIAGCYIAGFRIVFPNIVIETFTNTVITLAQTLGGVIGVNLILLLCSSWIKNSIRKR